MYVFDSVLKLRALVSCRTWLRRLITLNLERIKEEEARARRRGREGGREGEDTINKLY